jgi:hypothetical protein
MTHQNVECFNRMRSNKNEVTLAVVIEYAGAGSDSSYVMTEGERICAPIKPSANLDKSALVLL